MAVLTRQKVQAMLRKAGLSKHERHTTNVRGWSSHISGYDVREDGDHIYVEWYCGDRFMSTERENSRRQAECARYAEVLAAHSPESTVGSWGQPCIRVKAAP